MSGRTTRVLRLHPSILRRAQDERMQSLSGGWPLLPQPQGEILAIPSEHADCNRTLRSCSRRRLRRGCGLRLEQLPYLPATAFSPGRRLPTCPSFRRRKGLEREVYDVCVAQCDRQAKQFVLVRGHRYHSPVLPKPPRSAVPNPVTSSQFTRGTGMSSAWAIRSPRSTVTGAAVTLKKRAWISSVSPQ